MYHRSHFVEEISSPDVALSRPGTYPNKRRRPPENEENREAPMALTTTGEGKERKHDPLQRIFPILTHRDGNLKELNEKKVLQSSVTDVSRRTRQTRGRNILQYSQKSRDDKQSPYTESHTGNQKRLEDHETPTKNIFNYIHPRPPHSNT